MNTLKHPRLGLAGVAAMVAVCVTALVLTGAGPADDAATRGADATAMQSQKCVLCGRSFADKLGRARIGLPRLDMYPALFLAISAQLNRFVPCENWLVS